MVALGRSFIVKKPNLKCLILSEVSIGGVLKRS
jgi:hypothetical protein